MKETTWSILCPELDKLRNKEKSFGCFVFQKARWWVGYYRAVRFDWTTVECWGYELYDIEDYNILWHPLNWWRIEHLSDLHWTEQLDPNVTLDAIQEQYDTIHMIDIFLTWHSLKDQNELQRQTNEKRPELKELLIQFASYF